MKVYIFRILSEEEETFLREIALSEDNTLLDFHTILTKSMNLSDRQLASFYLTSKQWEKQKEYTLVDMEIDDYTNEREKEEPFPIDVMENAHIGDIIEEPKQHLLYEYNFVNPTLFFISLIDTKEVKEEGGYPKILHSEGTIDIENIKMFDDSLAAEMMTRGKEYESYDDLVDEGYDEDDLRALGFESEDGLYDDEFFGSDSYGGNEDY